jgi:hypothetical protein
VDVADDGRARLADRLHRRVEVRDLEPEQDTVPEGLLGVGEGPMVILDFEVPETTPSASEAYGGTRLQVVLNSTNSAGRTGAIPTRQTRRPLSMSSWVIVIRSHRTK